MKQYVAWYRVSTERQGKSGLGLAAQKAMVEYFVKIEQGELIAEFSEVYTGKDLTGCSELQKAIELCKINGYTLAIAKTDRFRNTEEALHIYNEMNGNIYFCDLPHTDKFALTLAFALAEREALTTSIRTKLALAEKKKQGAHLGSEKGCDMTVAYSKSVEVRRNRARDNKNNRLFYGALTNYERTHGKITPNTDLNDFVTELNRLGAKTATGMEITYNRCRPMIVKTKKIYNMND